MERTKYRAYVLLRELMAHSLATISKTYLWIVLFVDEFKVYRNCSYRHEEMKQSTSVMKWCTTTSCISRSWNGDINGAIHRIFLFLQDSFDAVTSKQYNRTRKTAFRVLTPSKRYGNIPMLPKPLESLARISSRDGSIFSPTRQ